MTAARRTQADWADWQKRFNACPVTYILWVRYEGEETVEGVYVSEEAAAVHRDWYNSRRPCVGKAFVRLHRICSLELVKERFSV